jgi:hypothetical protein
MAVRRTTVVAREEDLDTLAHEARARGTSLGRMLGEIVGERAVELRSERRPRLGTFSAEVSIAKLAEQEDPVAVPFRDE